MPLSFSLSLSEKIDRTPHLLCDRVVSIRSESINHLPFFRCSINRYRCAAISIPNTKPRFARQPLRFAEPSPCIYRGPRGLLPDRERVLFLSTASLRHWCSRHRRRPHAEVFCRCSLATAGDVCPDSFSARAVASRGCFCEEFGGWLAHRITRGESRWTVPAANCDACIESVA